MSRDLKRNRYGNYEDAANFLLLGYQMNQKQKNKMDMQVQMVGKSGDLLTGDNRLHCIALQTSGTFLQKTHNRPACISRHYFFSYVRNLAKSAFFHFSLKTITWLLTTIYR